MAKTRRKNGDPVSGKPPFDESPSKSAGVASTRTNLGTTGRSVLRITGTAIAILLASMSAQASNPSNACEVCVHAVENTSRSVEPPCRGLKEKASQESCQRIMRALEAEGGRTWIAEGCTREESGQRKHVKPCPAHAICAHLRECPPDPRYSVPPGKKK